jgi:hypothetical protein
MQQAASSLEVEKAIVAPYEDTLWLASCPPFTA